MGDVETDRRRVLVALFDLEFRELLTVRLIPLVYGALVLVAVVPCVLLVVAGFGASAWWGVLATAAAPAVFLAGVVVARIAVEFVLAVFELLDGVRHLRAVVDGVAGQTEEIAGNLPRLNFWRRRPGS